MYTPELAWQDGHAFQATDRLLCALVQLQIWSLLWLDTVVWHLIKLWIAALVTSGNMYAFP